MTNQKFAAEDILLELKNSPGTLSDDTVLAELQDGSVFRASLRAASSFYFSVVVSSADMQRRVVFNVGAAVLDFFTVGHIKSQLATKLGVSSTDLVIMGTTGPIADTTTIRTLNIGPGTKLVATMREGSTAMAGSKRSREADTEAPEPKAPKPSKEAWAALSDVAREESRARWFIEKARKNVEIHELFCKAAQDDAERAESIVRDFPHNDVKP